MNPVAETDRFPPADLFVSAMWDRVLDAYPRVMSVAVTAMVQAGGDRDAIDRMVRHEANRVVFLIGCCAEELVSSGFVVKGDAAERYVAGMITALRALAHPDWSSRVEPDVLRLLAEFEKNPVRLRVQTIQYMLALNELAHEQHIVSEDAACQLQIECSVTVDGIAGCLIEMMKPATSAGPDAEAFTVEGTELGPVISDTLRRLP
ncbi:MAG: hypothetical protein MEQ84_01575 [Mesorhizobium sp.]|nr:hypothetical protein [Mesorhizobium sp.]